MPLAAEGWSLLRRLCPPLLPHLCTPILYSLLSLLLSSPCLGPWAIPDKHSETEKQKNEAKLNI